MSELYKVTADDTEAASRMLAEAFRDYPTFEYIFPDPEQRERDLRKMLDFLLKCGLLHGEVLASSKNLEGIAIWYRDGAMDYPPASVLKAGLLRLFSGINPVSFIKFIHLGGLKRKNRETMMEAPYYFLDLIGVSPLQRNRGFARILLEEKLTGMDREKIRCYLETTETGNIAFYEHYGFHLHHTFTFGRCTSYCLLRESR